MLGSNLRARRTDRTKTLPAAATLDADQPEGETQARRNLDDIEEAETGIWLYEQLNRIRAVLVELDGDEEMLNAVDYLIGENEQWINPELETALRSGGLRSGEA